MEKEESKFVLRSYPKAELALLYFPGNDPDSAVRNLRRWIMRQPEIMAAFEAVGYDKKLHSYFKREVEIIVKYLGEP